MVSYIKTALENYFSIPVNMAVVSVSSGYSIRGSCITFSDLNLSSGLVVKDENDNPVYFEKSGNSLSTELGNGNKNFFKIYSADEVFTDYSKSLANCDTPSQNDYSVAIARTDEIPSYSKIKHSISNFTNEYALLKNEFKIPSEVDFSYKFKFANGTVEGTPTDESNKDIYAEEFAMNYIDIDSNIQTGMLTVNVW